LHHRRIPPLFFWRGRTGHEIDLLIEEADPLYPVEIKSGNTMSHDILDGLLGWTRLAGAGTLVYGGGEAFTRNNMPACPWFAV